MLALRVALQNLYFRPALNWRGDPLVVGLAVAQAAVVLLLARAIENGLVRASRPFELLVGAKGSPTQLIMNAILLQEAPVGKTSHWPILTGYGVIESGFCRPPGAGRQRLWHAASGCWAALFELADPTQHGNPTSLSLRVASLFRHLKQWLVRRPPGAGRSVRRLRANMGSSRMLLGRPMRPCTPSSVCYIRATRRWTEPSSYRSTAIGTSMRRTRWRNVRSP